MKIKISFFAVMLILSLVLTSSCYAFIPLIAAAIHELGHIICARLLGIRLSGFELGIFGARISTNTSLCPYSAEFMIAAAGPFCNLISADVTAIICKISGEYSEISKMFILSSLALGITNLLPIKTFDGGRMFSALMSKFFNISFVEIILDILSFLSLFFIWGVSLYLLLRTSASLSLFVFSLSVFSNIFIAERNNFS